MLQKIGADVKRDMIDPEENLSISAQCSFLGLSRGFYYYKPVEISEFELDLLRKLDELYTEDPTFGTRRMRKALRKRYNLHVGRARWGVSWFVFVFFSEFA